VIEVPGLDGQIDFGIGGYRSRIINANIYFDGDFADLRANREQIIAWLSNSAGQPKQLAFGDELNRYYMAKIYSALDFINLPDHLIGTVQFECNPPWQYENGILLTPDQIAWNTTDGVSGNQYYKDFSASGSMRFTNPGTLPVKPQIMLIGNIPADILLGYNGALWQYDPALQYDGILIDCNAETVTRMSDGANIYSNVDNVNDDYFIIAPGQAEIDLTAPALGAWPNDLTMFVQFDPRYMA
jgi:predicted phage tail component-like protein